IAPRGCSAGTTAAAVRRSNLAVSDAALFEILLVVVLRFPEGWGRGNLGHHWSGVTATALQVFLGLARRRLLLPIVHEDGGPILRADVRSLAVQRRRIVVLPKDLEQRFITDLGWVVFHLHRLGVAGTVRAYLVIGRIGRRPTGVAHPRADDAGRVANHVLDTPETACRECRLAICAYSDARDIG